MKVAELIADTDPDQGLALFNVALTGLDALTPEEQQESASRRLRGSILRRRAETETLLGRYDEADHDFAQVQQFTDSILAIDPGDTRAKWDLAVVIHARGDLERTRGRLALAREHYEKVVDLLEKFPGLEQSSQARASLDDALIGLGDILVQLKDPSGRKMTQRGLSDLRVLAQSKEASPEILEKAAADFLDAQPPDLEDARFALDCVNRASASARNPAALATKARALARLGDKAGAREAAISGLALLPAPNSGAPARGLRLQLMQLAGVVEIR
jgi:tetratricopeptide (TPR) repeat protein